MFLKNLLYKLKSLQVPRWLCYTGMFLTVALVSFLFLYGTEPIEAALTTTKEISVDKGLIAPEITAQSAILFNAHTGDILFEKDKSESVYPASTTKILTALLTIETVEKYNSDITQKVTVPKEATNIEGSSIYLKPGEDISLEDLLYGLMLRSGNDAAKALAYIIGGTEENFVDMMNQRAQELGCKNTHFTNPSGLYNEEHYTTAFDMAVIAQAAMQNETFRTIAASKSWQSSRTTDSYPVFTNKNKVVFQYEGGNGIKIGYTEKSGRTLVASAERDGELLICVLMNAPDWFNDSYKLLDYGFTRI